MTSVAAPFAHSSGPRDAKIALIGEAWGQAEALVGVPFVGASGQELTRMLIDAGLRRSDCFLSNVFALRPEGNDLANLCGKKAEVGEGYSLPPISSGKYIRPKFLPEVDRLREELSIVRPNIIVALGNTACWALLGSAGVSNLRGTVTETPLGKVLPTYHPASVLRNWAQRPIVLADLMKARREAESLALTRQRRFLTVAPTLEEIENWYVGNAEAQYLAVDIETANGQLDMIGFASSPTNALVIPFFDKATGEHYWKDESSELAAWLWVKTFLDLPAKKIFQNGLYDMTWLYKIGLRVKNPLEDTMLLHHSMYPELQKGLGFLGSVYTNEQAWKLLNHRKGSEQVKADE